MRRLALSLLALACAGCPAASAHLPEARSPAADGVFAPTLAPAPPLPDVDSLLREATAGTHAGPEGELTSRMQLRPLRFPKPPRGAVARFNQDDGLRGWVATMPGEHLLNTPAYAKGKVMLGGGFASHEMYALDATTGEPKWTAPAPDGGPSPPIVESDDLLFNTESCELFVLDVATGKTLWHKFLGDPLMSQPAAAGGLVFSAYPADGGHRFGAFRLKDGEPAWSQPIGADVIAAPQIAGDSIYLTTMDGAAERLERRSGRVVWKRDAGAASAPTVDEGRVLFTRELGHGKDAREQAVVVSAADGRTLFEGERMPAPYFGGETRDRDLARSQPGAWGSVPSGEHLGLDNVTSGWAFQGSTASVADGRAYYAVGGELRAREVATGKLVWQRDYAKAKGAQAVSPPSVVGGQMFFGTIDGHLYAVDVDTGMTTWAYDVGEPVVYQPIVAEGWLYATTAKGRVLGLELGAPTLDGWHMWGGNAGHAGLVETAGAVDPSALAALERPPEGTLRVAEAGREPTADMPLSGTEVHARVRGVEATVTVVQHFKNPFDHAIEAVYLYPLPSDAAVDTMVMHVGSRVVRADVERRAEAQATYAEAKAGGKHAALLEQQRPNLFAERVANIGPGEKVDVEIAYAHPVPFEDGRYEFTFPMGVPKRFDPGAPAPSPAPSAAPSPDSVAAAGVDLASAPPVSLELAIDAGLPLGDVASPTHAVETERLETGRAVVRIAPGAVSDHDFVLRYDTSGAAPRAAVLAERDGDSGYFSLVVQPPAAALAPPSVPRDVTLVLDTSSSMRGRPLDAAREVGARILRGLGEKDTLRLVAFDDATRELDAAPLPATPENVGRAVAFLDAQRAAGGTRMTEAVHAALSGPAAAPSRLRLVVLMSDGFLGNEADVLSEIARGLGDARLFTLGVGASPNRFLLERAAEIGRGRVAILSPSDDAAGAAARFAAWVEHPVFTDLSVDWGGLDVADVYPRRLPDLFEGKPLVVTGRYAAGGKAKVRVEGTYAGQRYERAIDVELPRAVGDGRGAERILWARAAVHDRMQAMTLHDDPRLIEEVTRIGLANHLVTPWTSLVAVDDTASEGAHTEAGATSTQAMLSPARTLPGDPEVRIAAPVDARAVTVDLPFGETLEARWSPEDGCWVARFLVPRDAPEGSHRVRVTITLADGTREVRDIGYTVDSSPPKLAFQVRGAPRPGALVTILGKQVAAGPGERVMLDTRRVELRMPDGTVFPMAQTARGAWESRVRVPEGATGTLAIHAFAIDQAANVGEGEVDIEVER